MADNYSCEITVSNAPSEAFKALTADYNKWWTTDCNSIATTGDHITFRFDSSYWVMRANSIVPDKYIELECVEAHHVHDGLPSSILNEWKGTKLKWDIQKQNEKTKIMLIHEGLNASLDCYEVCEQGWDYFFARSLRQYLETGKGQPFETTAG